MWIGSCTDDNMRKRVMLRRSNRIVQVLKVWWQTALRTMAVSAGISPDELSPDDEDVVIDQEGHAMCLRVIYRALLDEHEEIEAEKAIERDCARAPALTPNSQSGPAHRLPTAVSLAGSSDTYSELALSRERFCDAIFESVPLPANHD
jgi:hypothetical protein